MTDEPRAPTDFDSRPRVSICIQSQIQIDLESIEWYNRLMAFLTREYNETFDLYIL